MPVTPPSLSSTTIVNADHPEVIAFAHAHRGSAADPRSQAVSLYYAVRDSIRYDPYELDLTPQGLSASRVLQTGRGWCVTKSVLLAAVCRVVSIPARLGFADVRNHLSTERLRQTMKTDVFYWHGYTAIQLDGQWLKATPAFNIELCDRFGMLPLEFDGTADSIYHPFDRAGNRHMEYLNLRGEHDDVPLADMRATFAEHYAHMSRLGDADFDADVALETAS
ncbi:transglutaminase-like domain-containing protein [Sinimarinibacterium sp. CAU 1509]|uniref:transglutaminase-like domain-containing protein n=1 Tax=Sinimarinibacterium sp. CAU 1509 TaxID=2562283 RepID=UPI001B7FEF14|nr:transglutaminase family protein [Sinimarinibacterium sp. CAU 1509]